jgi:hypothetical protein
MIKNIYISPRPHYMAIRAKSVGRLQHSALLLPAMLPVSVLAGTKKGVCSMKKLRCRGRSSLAGFISALFVAVSADATTLIVTSTADSGAGTLRQAILDANSDDTINFSTGITTISLTSAELLIDKNLTITGPGANLLTVQRSTAGGTPAFRIFEIAFGNLSVTISGLTITNGNDGGSDGGGIFNQSNGGTLTITGCTISGNVADGDGGGIKNSFGTVVITSSTLSGNSAAGDGGGIYNDNGGVTWTSSTLSGNSATGDGGGIYNNAGKMAMTNSTLSANSANGEGGGIENHNSGFDITNSTLSGNSAQNGGGLRNDDGGEMNLTNCTITANSAKGVGGVDTSAGDGMGISNTIIAKNTDSDGNPDCLGSFSSSGYNLIGDDSGATITPATGDQIGTAGSPIDPRLGPLQDNGGPTQTQALLAGSTAIDKGNSSGSNTDQRGFARPVDNPAIPNATGGDGSDIGAFEVQVQVQGPSFLANISTRLLVETGDNVLIGGFIVSGTQPKKIIVRGIGPSLSSFFSGALADPILELHGPSGFATITNDNWRSDQEAEIMATGVPPSNDLESAIVAILPANNAGYTAIVRGVNNGTGIGVVEAYDLDRTVDSKLANISTRGFVQTGDNVLIGGFIVEGQDPLRVIVRAIGPSLPVSGALADPTLELHDSNGVLIAFNDNWRSDQEAEIIATGIPPSNDQESAIVRDLAPGGYTAIVRGLNSTTGIAVVEAYDLN